VNGNTLTKVAAVGLRRTPGGVFQVSPNPRVQHGAGETASRLLSVLHQAGGVTVDGATYTVDDAGNRTGKTNHTTTRPSSMSMTLAFEGPALSARLPVRSGYDAQGRRTSLTCPSGVEREQKSAWILMSGGV